MDKAAIKARVNEIIKTPYDNRKTLFAALFKDVLSDSGISIREISHQTRISINFLEAFESGKLESLPGDVFGRGFLRNISKIIGLESDFLVTAYNACLDDTPTIGHTEDLEKVNSIAANEKTVSGTVSAMAQSATTDVNKSENPSSNSPFKLVLPFVGAAVAIALVLWPTENEQHTSKNLPFAVQAMKNAAVKRPADVALSAKAPVAVEPSSQANTAMTAVKPEGEVAPLASLDHQSETAAFEQVVEIKVLEPVKIKKTIDKGETVSENLDPKTYRFIFDEKAEFLIYDASAVQVNFNGRSIGDLGEKGRIRRISFAKKPENKASM